MVGISAPSPVASRLSPAPLSKPTSLFTLIVQHILLECQYLFINFFIFFTSFFSRFLMRQFSQPVAGQLGVRLPLSYIVSIAHWLNLVKCFRKKIFLFFSQFFLDIFLAMCYTAQYAPPHPATAQGRPFRREQNSLCVLHAYSLGQCVCILSTTIYCCVCSIYYCVCCLLLVCVIYCCVVLCVYCCYTVYYYYYCTVCVQYLLLCCWLCVLLSSVVYYYYYYYCYYYYYLLFCCYYVCTIYCCVCVCSVVCVLLHYTLPTCLGTRTTHAQYLCVSLLLCCCQCYCVLCVSLVACCVCCCCACVCH